MANSKIKDTFKWFLIFLLSLNIIVIFIDMINITPQFQKTFRAIIFFNAIIFTLYFLKKARLDQALTYIIVCVLFNPYYAIYFENQIWLVLEFPILCLFIHRMYFLLFEKQLSQVEKDADKIDQYFKELEHTIATLTYHQISIYIKRKYPQSSQIGTESITWTIPGLDDVEFEILREFYSLGKNSKGGVNAKLMNKYHNMEAHLNFNLTEEVKYTIIEGKGKNKPNRLAKHIKTVLVTKYHYLDI
ncbi:MAG: hypothetical protein JSR17_06670 [Proteobacteria bacterium]|nr:hypothetical protein [Pseudomonadota bacterium]